MLKTEFSVQEVYLIGSLSQESPITPLSDIDLAVKGLDPYKYLKALNRCYQILEQGQELDLLTFESLGKDFQREIEQYGIRL
jgi:predicted nucleotidyltransferase